MRRTRLRLTRSILLTMTASALWLSGCASLFGPARMGLPGQFDPKRQSPQLLDPATRASAYRTLFPPMPNLYMTGVQMTASSHRWQGSANCSLMYFAQDRNNLRVRGYKQSANLFDLVLREGFMTVLFPGRGEAYQGRLNSRESPFGKRYGVEPWDLIPVFSIGQWIANNELTQRSEGGRIELRPETGNDSGGIQWVQLDRRSGLPRCLQWQGEGRSYSVLYREWAYYEDEKIEGPARLMPKKVQIEREDGTGRVRLTVGRYRFGKPPDRIFTPVESFNYQYYPLGDMNGILERL